MDIKGSEFKLVINNVDIEDMGHYVLKIEVEDGENGNILEKTVDTYLMFKANPKVTLNMSQPYSHDFYRYRHA